MNVTSRFLALTALTLLLGACTDPNKEPASAVLRGAEAALAAAREEAGRFAPAELGGASAALESARAAFAAGRYGDALRAGQDAGARIEALARTAKARKDALQEVWSSVATSLPETLTVLRSLVGELGGLKRLPSGISPAMVTRARAELEAVSAAWEKAQASSASGALTEAVAQAQGLPDRAQAIVSLLAPGKP